MQNDEQIIADLSASLRLALLYLETFGVVLKEGAPGFAPKIHRGGTEPLPFDADEARRLLAGAAARLATIQPRRPELALQISEARASEISEGLADMLCWTRGFIAGRPDQPDDHPMGVEAVRSAREALRQAVRVARGQQEEELPF